MKKLFALIICLLFFPAVSAMAAEVEAKTSSDKYIYGVPENTAILYFTVTSAADGTADGPLTGLPGGKFKGIWVEPSSTATPNATGTIAVNRAGVGGMTSDLLGGTGTGSAISTMRNTFLTAYDGSVFRAIEIDENDTITLSCTGMGASKIWYVGVVVDVKGD